MISKEIPFDVISNVLELIDKCMCIITNKRKWGCEMGNCNKQICSDCIYSCSDCGHGYCYECLKQCCFCKYNVCYYCRYIQKTDEGEKYYTCYGCAI